MVSSPSLVHNAIEAPAVGNALELVLTGVREGETGSRRQSFTVWDTRISPGPAGAATRAPMCTVIPRTRPPTSSTSPVWTPARISMPMGRTPRRCSLRNRPPEPDRRRAGFKLGRRDVDGFPVNVRDLLRFWNRGSGCR
jgi:hypothetical protein